VTTVVLEAYLLIYLLAYFPPTEGYKTKKKASISTEIKPQVGVSWEFNVTFQHKYGYIRDKRSGVESYLYQYEASMQV